MLDSDSQRMRAAFGLGTSMMLDISNAIKQKATARQLAARERDIAREEEAFQSEENARLYARQSVLGAKQGKSGGSMADLLSATSYLQGKQLARIGFKNRAMADHLDARGDAAEAAYVASSVQRLATYRALMEVIDEGDDSPGSRDRAEILQASLGSGLFGFSASGGRY